MLWFEEVSSTQELAKERELPCGTVVVADRQKKGKGRKGRRWESQEGGLYFSFVLCEKDFRDFIQLPLVVGFALSLYLEHVGVKTGIKWPNDVYARGKKISGVLVEKSAGRIVVGVGLNVNQESFPKELEVGATSIRLITGREYDRRDILRGVLDSISDNVNLYRLEGFEPFKEKIEDRLLFKGEEVVILGDKPEVGILIGIDEEGFLLLHTPAGEKRIVAGDVSLRLYR